MLQNYIFLLFFTELFFLVASYSITKGNLLSPSLLSYIMFTVATICAIYNIDFWDVQYSFKAWIVTSFGFFSMLLPEIILSRKGTNATSNITKNYRTADLDPLLNGSIILLSVIITVFYIFAIFRRGHALGATGLNVIGIAKYDTTLNRSVLEKLIYRISMILFYFYSFFVIKNIVVFKKRIKSQKYNIIPIICFFIVTFFTGNRMGLLKCLLALYTGILSMMYQSITFKKKNVKLIFKYVIVCALALIIIFYLSRVISKMNTTTAERTFGEYITYYIGSPVYLFSKYLDSPLSIHASNNLIGETVFASVWINLGYNPKYENNFTYVGGYSNFAGNAYTWFQEPYNDFGFIGMFIFTYIIYWIFDYILYRGVLKKRNDCFTILMMYFDFVFVTSFYYCQTMWAISLTNITYVVLIIFLIKVLPKIQILD